MFALTRTPVNTPPQTAAGSPAIVVQGPAWPPARPDEQRHPARGARLPLPPPVHVDGNRCPVHAHLATFLLNIYPAEHSLPVYLAYQTAGYVPSLVTPGFTHLS